MAVVDGGAGEGEVGLVDGAAGSGLGAVDPGGLAESGVEVDEARVNSEAFGVEDFGVEGDFDFVGGADGLDDAVADDDGAGVDGEGGRGDDPGVFQGVGWGVVVGFEIGGGAGFGGEEESEGGESEQGAGMGGESGCERQHDRLSNERRGEAMVARSVKGAERAVLEPSATR